MEFFYHVSRDIELPRSTRHARWQPGPRACDACGAELDDGEEPVASDTGTYGLTFCADCLTRLDRSAIQIHFCDGCGISVPLYAVEHGAALAGDGRILCLRCRTPPARDDRLRWLLIAALAALALGIGLVVLLGA